MTEVGMFEAKTRLSELVARVLAGEAVVITRRGEPVARLVPIAGGSHRDSAARLIDQIRQRRVGHPLGAGMSIRELIEEGRR
jgi:prevent-host-death family protein